MKRTKPIRRVAAKRAGYSRRELLMLDRLAREAVFLRDQHRCQVGYTDGRAHECGGRMEWAHIDSRKYRTTRWLPDNSVVLCSRHHFWWHDRPREGVLWWTRTFPERCESVSHASAGPKPDYELMKHGLEMYIQELTDGHL